MIIIVTDKDLIPPHFERKPENVILEHLRGNAYSAALDADAVIYTDGKTLYLLKDRYDLANVVRTVNDDTPIRI